MTSDQEKKKDGKNEKISKPCTCSDISALPTNECKVISRILFTKDLNDLDKKDWHPLPEIINSQDNPIPVHKFTATFGEFKESPFIKALENAPAYLFNPFTGQMIQIYKGNTK